MSFDPGNSRAIYFCHDERLLTLKLKHKHTYTFLSIRFLLQEIQVNGAHR